MKRNVLVSVIGLVAGVLLVLKVTARKRSGNRSTIDEYLEEQKSALRLLEDLRVNAFEGSEERLAIALGRPPVDIRDWVSGQQTIDADARMKVHALALHRGIEVN